MTRSDYVGQAANNEREVATAANEVAAGSVAQQGILHLLERLQEGGPVPHTKTLARSTCGQARVNAARWW